MRLMTSRRYSKSEIPAKIDGVRRNMSIFAIFIRPYTGRYDL